MSKIIIFYSRTGNTKAVAEKYAEKNNIAIYGIKDLVNRKGFFGFIKSFFQTLVKKETNIEDIEADISEYSRVILCTPVWVGSIPSPVRSFISRYGKLINKVEYIITYSNPKKEYRKIFKEMDALIGKKHVREVQVVINNK